MPKTTKEKLTAMLKDASVLSGKLAYAILQEDISKTAEDLGKEPHELSALEVLQKIARDFEIDPGERSESQLLAKLKQDSVLSDGDHRVILENISTLDVSTRALDLKAVTDDLTNNGTSLLPDKSRIRSALIKKLCSDFDVEITRHERGRDEVLLKKLKDARALNDSDIALFDLAVEDAVKNEHRLVYLHTAEEDGLTAYSKAMHQIVFGGSRGRTSPDYDNVQHLHVDGNAQSNLIFTSKSAGVHFLGEIPFHMENGLDRGKRDRIKNVHDRHSSSSVSEYRLYRDKRLEKAED